MSDSNVHIRKFSRDSTQIRVAVIMFQLSKEEVDFLRSQNATLEISSNLKSQNVISSWGGINKLSCIDVITSISADVVLNYVR